MSEVAKWYQGKNIFITGGTGLVGKSLVEKLLRDCPDTGYIYLLIRPKNGVSFDQRMLDYTNHVVFSCLKANQSHVFDKLRFIEGDLRATDMGISDVDKKIVAETVSVIFHSAADVRFDQPLIDAYNSNVKGTEGLLKFATQFKHIDAFVLVSTAFSQPNDVGKLEERHYPSTIEPELLKCFVNNIDPDILHILAPKLLGKFPNTYGFTKSISEQLVYDYRDKFPTAIARPAIIVMAWKEPLIGYTEGIHSVNGWCLASGRGVLRSMCCRENYPSNLIPNDIVVNGIIVLAHERGKRNQNRLQSSNQVPTFNNSEGSNNSAQITAQTNEPLYFNIAEEKPMSWKQYVDTLQPNFFRTPYNYALWFPSGSFKTNRLHHFICVVLFQLLPAILVDTLLVIFRRPPILMKVQRKIASSCQALDYYMLNFFVFKTEVYNATVGRLNEIDKQIFYDKSRMITLDYFRGAAVGARAYLVKEKPEDIPKARKTFRRLFYLDVATKTLITCWLIQKVFNYFELSIY